MGKRNNDLDASSILLGIIVLVVYFAIVLIPIFLIIGWIVNFTSYRRNYKNKFENGFWLDKNQKKLFKLLTERVDYCYEQIRLANQTADAEGIARNKDGQISSKSYRGKNLRSIIGKSQWQINEDEPEIDDLSEQPRSNYKKYRKTYSLMLGCGYAVVFYAGYFLYYYVNNNLESIFAEKGILEGFIAISSKISIQSLAVFVIIYIIGIIKFRINFGGKPPFVSIENVDTYKDPNYVEKESWEMPKPSTSATNVKPQREFTNPIEIQLYFWDELRRQLKQMGYPIDTSENLSQKIEQYYANNENRDWYKWYGFSFEIGKNPEGNSIKFCVQIDDVYFFSFPRFQKKYQDEKISQSLHNIGFTEWEDENLFAGRHPYQEISIDFWSFRGCEKINSDSQESREFISKIACQIDSYIKAFKKEYNQLQ